MVHVLDAPTVDQNIAVGEVVDLADAFDQRGFPYAVGSYDAIEARFVDDQIDSVEGRGGTPVGEPEVPHLDGSMSIVLYNG